MWFVFYLLINLSIYLLTFFRRLGRFCLICRLKINIAMTVNNINIYFKITIYWIYLQGATNSTFLVVYLTGTQMIIASYLSWYKLNMYLVIKMKYIKLHVSERYSFSNLKPRVRTRRTTTAYTNVCAWLHSLHAGTLLQYLTSTWLPGDLAY
jgi:hypothetical protein